MLQHSGLGIIDEHLNWNTAQELEGVLMSAQEVFGRLAEARLETREAAMAKHQDKEVVWFSSVVLDPDLISRMSRPLRTSTWTVQGVFL
jgi:hypothetical protein